MPVLERTAVMPRVRPRHRGPGWWRRNGWTVAMVAALGPLALAGGWVVAALTTSTPTGVVLPYGALDVAPVALGPAHPTMSVASNTARPVVASKAAAPTGRYSPTYHPVVAATVAVTPRFLPATTKPSATATPSRGPTPTTTGGR